MQLTEAQIKEYNDRGYLFLPGHFTPDEMAVLTRELRWRMMTDLLQLPCGEGDRVSTRDRKG